MDSVFQAIIEQADQLAPKLREIRRDFHRYPERGWFEVRTSSIIAKRLTDLGYTVLTGRDVCKADARMGVPPQEELDAQYARACAQGAVQPYAEQVKDGFTGVIALLDCGEGPVIGMRFDIDALGVYEDKSSDHFPAREGFCSTNEGVMHACGHDGHAAIGLGVAEVLMSVRQSLRGKIKLVFQPAEEGVRGARSIAESGWLDDVDYMLGNHISARTVAGAQVGVTTGTTLATTKLDVYFTGKACHAAMPDQGDNAMLAAATAVLNMHAIPRCRDGSTRINVGTMHAGTGRNVICDRAKLEVEVRGATTQLKEYMEQYCRRIAKAAAEMHGCTCEIVVMGAAESVVNDQPLLERCCQVCAEQLNLQVQQPQVKANGSEDYSYMANRVRSHGGQSLFFYTLSEPFGPGHSKTFDFSEESLSTGVKVFCGMAYDLMQHAR